MEHSGSTGSSSHPGSADAADVRQRALRRTLRASAADGVSFSVMVGMGETYFAAFALAVGMSQTIAGLLGTVPILLGAFLQLVGPAGIKALGSLRRWVVFCAAAQGIMLLPISGGALLGEMNEAVLLLFATLYWGAGLATGPAWNAWIGAILPASIRTRFLALRSRLCQGSLLLGLLAAGLALEFGEKWGNLLVIFAIIFAIAAAARFFSAAMLARQSDAPTNLEPARTISIREWLARARRTPDGHLLFYMFLVQVAVQISGPFFTPFMLGRLEFSYVEYLAVISVAYSSKVIAMPLLGQLAKRYGPQGMLWISGFGVVPLSALWLISQTVPFLIFVQALSGVMWGMWELATLLLLFDRIPQRERTSVLTIFNLANALAMVGGSLLGAAILSGMKETVVAYELLFALSAVTRLISLVWLTRVVGPESRPRRIRIRPLITRDVAVRPQVGSIDPPIIAGIEKVHGRGGGTYSSTESTAREP
jgi:hypothetical protein